MKLVKYMNVNRTENDSRAVLEASAARVQFTRISRAFQFSLGVYLTCTLSLYISIFKLCLSSHSFSYTMSPLCICQIDQTRACFNSIQFCVLFSIAEFYSVLVKYLSSFFSSRAGVDWTALELTQAGRPPAFMFANTVVCCAYVLCERAESS